MAEKKLAINPIHAAFEQFLLGIVAAVQQLEAALKAANQLRTLEGAETDQSEAAMEAAIENYRKAYEATMALAVAITGPGNAQSYREAVCDAVESLLGWELSKDFVIQVGFPAVQVLVERMVALKFVSKECKKATIKPGDEPTFF